MSAAAAETERLPDVPSEWPYRFEVLEVSKLIVDESYQRPLTSFVTRIEKNFDPALVGTIVVSERKNSVFAVVDGWTRKTGAERRGVTELPCIVYTGLSPQQEAALFSKLQKERRGIASYHRFRAAVAAGEDEAVQIQRLARECGYEIGTNSKAQISAVAGLESVYRRAPTLLERVLVIYKEAWKEQYMPGGDMLKGLGYFLERNTGADDEKLARRLSVVTPDDLKKRTLALSEGMGGGSREKNKAAAIEGIYKRGRG
jgi:hypothetical protein